jgi:hypothetical protein
LSVAFGLHSTLVVGTVGLDLATAPYLLSQVARLRALPA